LTWFDQVWVSLSAISSGMAHLSTPIAREDIFLTRQHRYGYHMPRTHARDKYYKKLEDERAARTEA